MKKQRRLSARASVAVGLALTLAAGTTSCAKAPDQDTFYTQPATGAAGELVRSRTAKFSADSNVKSWQVIYRSTDASDAGMTVSGTVLVPGKPWAGTGPRPLVTYGVGTRGIGDGCAPSYTLAGAFDYESGIINGLLGKGYAVVVTDYQGLGTPGGHTYMVGRSQGHAALDLVRAAFKLPGAGLAVDSPVGIWGYSQGGATSAWAAELAPTYAPELKIKGAVMGGVPADLLAVANGLDGTIYVAFGLLAAFGYDSAYPDLHLSTFLNDDGRKLYESAKNMCLVGLDGISTFLGVANHKMTDYVTTDPRSTPEWQRRLGENRLGFNPPKMPILQYHGEKDTLVAYSQGKALRDTYCQAGANVTWKTFPNDDHVSGILVGQDTGVAFLVDRFNGVPTTGNC